MSVYAVAGFVVLSLVLVGGYFLTEALSKRHDTNLSDDRMVVVASTTTATTTSMTTSTYTSTVEASATDARSNKCYNVYSRMDVNSLQVYKENPDADAYGFATCRLCTNSSLSCTSLMHSGTTQLIAAHIHLASEGEGKDGSNTEGPPVINFCGSEAAGLIRDGTNYTQPCQQWDENGAAHDSHMPGVLVTNFNRGMTVADRVEDIAKRPHMYYFNFHSLASWNHWYPDPHGMCRGILEVETA